MSLSTRNAAASKGLIVLLLVIILGAIGWFLAWPEYGNLKTAKSDLVTAQTQKQEKSTLLSDLQGLIDSHKQKQKDLDVLKDALPSAPKIPQLLATLENLALTNMMDIESIRITEDKTAAATTAPVTAPATSYKPTTEDQTAGSPAGTAAPGGVSAAATIRQVKPELVPLKIEFSVFGEFAAFMSLLDSLEKNIRLFDINLLSTGSDTSAAPSADKNKKAGQNFRFTITTYYLK